MKPFLVATATRGSAPTIADVHREVLELRGRLDALEARLAPGPRDQADVALASTIALTARGLPFTAAAVWRRRAVDPDLAAAIVDADIANPRRLGKLLRRLEGRDCEGVCFTRAGLTREGILWRVCEVETRTT